MQVFRKKFLILMVTGVASLALLNVSMQFGRIIDCFPGMNLSYLLAEELAETAEGESEKGSESISELEFFLTRDNHTQHALSLSREISVLFHTTGIPPHPHFEKVTPPPKG